MLSSIQKADILVRAGIPVPALNATSNGEVPIQWRREIDNLFTSYVAARAARSLRDAEDKRIQADLREANTQQTHPRLPDDSDDD